MISRCICLAVLSLTGQAESRSFLGITSGSWKDSDVWGPRFEYQDPAAGVAAAESINSLSNEVLAAAASSSESKFLGASTEVTSLSKIEHKKAVMDEEHVVNKKAGVNKKVEAESAEEEAEDAEHAGEAQKEEDAEEKASMWARMKKEHELREAKEEAERIVREKKEEEEKLKEAEEDEEEHEAHAGEAAKELEARKAFQVKGDMLKHAVMDEAANSEHKGEAQRELEQHLQKSAVHYPWSA